MTIIITVANHPVGRVVTYQTTLDDPAGHLRIIQYEIATKRVLTERTYPDGRTEWLPRLRGYRPGMRAAYFNGLLVREPARAQWLTDRAGIQLEVT